MTAKDKSKQPASGAPPQSGQDVRDTSMNNLDTCDQTATPPELDERVMGVLGLKLSAYYGALVAETVPETFVALLKQLENKEKGE